MRDVLPNVSALVRAKVVTRAVRFVMYRFLMPCVRHFPAVAARVVFSFILVCTFLFSSASAHGQAATSQRSIRVVMDDNYPPYVFRNDSGELEGITIDQWRLWERKTGIKVEISAMDWGEALRRMRAGEFDVIDTIFKTDERSAYFDFTKTYARIEVPIFFRQGISGITDITSLRGFPVATKEGDAAVNLLQRQGIAPILLFKNYESIIAAAKEHKVNVFVVDKPPALYFLHKLGIAGDFRMSAPINVGEFRRAVRKGDTALVQQIEQGFAKVGPSALEGIDVKWQGRSVQSSPYLRNLGIITVAIIAVAALLGAWNWLLARQVRRRTRALEESEAKLRASDERLRSVLDGMFAFVGLVSADGILQDCNRAPLVAMKIRKEDIVGKPFADGQWFSHSAETQNQVRSLIRRAVEGNEAREDLQVRISPGFILDFDTSFSPIRDATGQVTQVVVSGVDITQRKRAETVLQGSEARFRMMIEGVKDYAIFMLDPDGRVANWNAGAQRISGYQSQEIIGQHFSTFYPPEERTTDKARRELSVAASEGRFEEEGWRMRKDGTRFIANVVITALRDDAGKLLGFVKVTRDITERKRAEEAIRKYESVFQNASWGMAIADAETQRLTHVNPAFARMHGFTVDEMIGMGLVETFSPEARLELAGHVQQAHEKGHHIYESVHIRKDGSRFPCLAEVTAVKDASGRIVFRAATFADITERKQAEMRIHQLNRVYAVLSGINELIVRQRERQAILDGACQIALEKGHFLLAWIGLVGPISDKIQVAAHAGASPETLKIIETMFSSPDPACELTAEALQTGGHSVCNDIEHDPAAQLWRDAALQRGYRSMVSLPLIIAGRRVGTFNLYAGETGFFNEEEIQLLDELAVDIAFALEVCEREQERQHAIEQVHVSEQRFRELAETIEEAFWITEPDKIRILYISPAYEKIWGRSIESLYEDPHSWFDSIHPDDRKRVLHAATTRQTEGTYDTEYRIVRPDGQVRWIRDRAFPVRNGSGMVERIVGVARDVTDRMAAEEQLRQSQKMEAIGQLAGGVAHDFNNILAAILMQAELTMTLENMPAEAKEGLREVRAAAERAAGLTRQLLLFSRRQVMQPRELDLNEIVTNLVKMLQRIIGENVRMQLHLHPAPLMTRADAGMLDQVLLNLAVNARDAMPEGGHLSVETSLRVVDEELARLHPDVEPGTYVCLSVTDSGHGIPKHVLSRIFEPFFTTKEPGKGTGLGLATVFGIVKQHKGWIKAYSEPGEGANFQIFLPAIAGVAAGRVQQTDQPLPRGGDETVLLVEDDPSVRTLTHTTLSRHGYTVLDAIDGVEALKLWEQHKERIELLLTDLVMPGGVGGRELAKRLQSERPALRVIFTSGYSAEIAGRELELRDGDNFIQKPFSRAQLLETVRRCLDA